MIPNISNYIPPTSLHKLINPFSRSVPTNQQPVYTAAKLPDMRPLPDNTFSSPKNWYAAQESIIIKCPHPFILSEFLQVTLLLQYQILNISFYYHIIFIIKHQRKIWIIIPDCTIKNCRSFKYNWHTRLFPINYSTSTHSLQHPLHLIHTPSGITQMSLYNKSNSQQAQIKII